MVFSDMRVVGSHSVKELIFRDLEEIVLAGSVLVNPDNDSVEAPQNPRFEIAVRMDRFVMRVSDVSSTLRKS